MGTCSADLTCCSFSLISRCRDKAVARLAKSSAEAAVKRWLASTIWARTSFSWEAEETKHTHTHAQKHARHFFCSSTARACLSVKDHATQAEVSVSECVCFFVFFFGYILSLYLLRQREPVLLAAVNELAERLREPGHLLRQEFSLQQLPLSLGYSRLQLCAEERSH